jgi:hypothetical protein
MKKFAVAYINFMDNELVITFVQADTWIDALDIVVDYPYFDEVETLEEAKAVAFDSEFMIDVKEIK